MSNNVSVLDVVNVVVSSWVVENIDSFAGVVLIEVVSCVASGVLEVCRVVVSSDTWFVD